MPGILSSSHALSLLGDLLAWAILAISDRNPIQLGLNVKEEGLLLFNKGKYQELPCSWHSPETHSLSPSLICLCLPLCWLHCNAGLVHMVSAQGDLVLSPKSFTFRASLFIALSQVLYTPSISLACIVGPQWNPSLWLRE